jgi:oligoribonuclease
MMYLIFLDTETTGLDPEKHRILEIAYKIFDTISDKFVVSYESVVAQPEAVWALADFESLTINGFQWEESLKGKTEKVIASEISNDLNRLGLREKKGVFICQNPSFDRAFFIQLIHTDIQRSFGWPYHWLDLASMYWTYRLMHHSHAAKELQESDLSKNEIAKFFSIQPEQEPHRAMNGVKHLILCYEEIFGKLGSSFNAS